MSKRAMKFEELKVWQKGQQVFFVVNELLGDSKMFFSKIRYCGLAYQYQITLPKALKENRIKNTNTFSMLPKAHVEKSGK